MDVNVYNNSASCMIPQWMYWHNRNKLNKNDTPNWMMCLSVLNYGCPQQMGTLKCTSKHTSTCTFSSSLALSPSTSQGYPPLSQRWRNDICNGTSTEPMCTYYTVNTVYTLNEQETTDPASTYSTYTHSECTPQNIWCSHYWVSQRWHDSILTHFTRTEQVRYWAIT